MKTFDKVKLLAETYNPVACRRRSMMRKKLNNKTVSLLVPNCLGGLLFHDLGLKFYSPTVNLMLSQRDFVEFVCRIKEFLEKDLVFFCDRKSKFPRATIGNITINFTHYPSEEEALRKWEERKMRIDYDNLFIVAMERDGIGEREIRRLGDIKARGILVFTAHKYPDIPYTVYLPQYAKDGEVGNILRRVSYLTDQREYEQYFDFVEWFNNANGMNYDVSHFVRI